MSPKSSAYGVRKRYEERLKKLKELEKEDFIRPIPVKKGGKTVYPLSAALNLFQHADGVTKDELPVPFGKNISVTIKTTERGESRIINPYRCASYQNISKNLANIDLKNLKELVKIILRYLNLNCKVKYKKREVTFKDFVENDASYFKRLKNGAKKIEDNLKKVWKSKDLNVIINSARYLSAILMVAEAAEARAFDGGKSARAAVRHLLSLLETLKKDDYTEKLKCFTTVFGRGGSFILSWENSNAARHCYDVSKDKRKRQILKKRKYMSEDSEEKRK